MKVTVTKDITEDLADVVTAVVRLQTDFICLGGILQEGFHKATKQSVIARVDDFLKEIDHIDVSQLQEDLTN